MKLLLELISFHRIDNDDDQGDTETGGVCPKCECDPCECEDDDGLNDRSDDMGRLDDMQDEHLADKVENEENTGAYDQGYSAFARGQGRENNPFERGTQEHDDWDFAWNDARQERQGGEEDEEQNEWGGYGYEQAGAHMGGAKDTDDGGVFDLDQDKSDENNDLDLDLDDDSEDNRDKDDEEDPKLDDITNKASEDPDRQGLIRTVKGAHLVYKRQEADGTYEELWIYNAGNMRDELEARKAILAGTDIPTNKTSSPDGHQKYELWSAGNAELLQIIGLPN